jgi:hypothetical protein
MANWFLSDAGLHAMGGQLVATSLLTPVAASATANAAGNWVPIYTATPFQASIIRVHLGKTGLAVSGSNTQTLLSISTGIGGAEAASMIAQDIAIGGALAYSVWDFPISVPIGSRLSVSTRSAVASKSVTMGMMVIGGGSTIESGYKAVTYGQVTTGSRGTILTAPTALNTPAAWTVITTATTSPARWLLVGVSAPNTTTAVTADLLIDIGIGTAGVEALVLTNIPCAIATNGSTCPYPLLFPVSIPVGSRLVARYRGTSIATTASPTITLTGIG